MQNRGGGVTEDLIVDDAAERRLRALAIVSSNVDVSTDIEDEEIRSVISGTKAYRFGWGAAASGEPGYLAMARAMSNSLYFGADRCSGALIMLVVNPHELTKSKSDYIEHLLVSLPEKRRDFVVKLFHDEQMAQDELLMNIFSN